MSDVWPTMRQRKGKTHWFYDQEGSVKVAACGWRSVTAEVGEGSFDCRLCHHVVEATNKFYEKHGDNCRFKLGPPREKPMRTGLWSRLEVLDEHHGH